MGSPICNLELSLVSPMRSSSGDDQREEKQHLPFTVFYNDSFCVCDVTEFQARSIIMLARNQEAATKENKLVRDEQGSQSSSPTFESSCPPAMGLSMKKSLQRFLQKRKGRAQAAAVEPYSRPANSVIRKKQNHLQQRHLVDGFQLLTPDY
ncbi:Protein TIFY 5A [Linum perenne]